MHARIGWQNLRTSEFLDSGDHLLITGTDFDDGAINYSTCHYVERKRYEQDKNIQIHNGSILITKDGTLGKVAYVKDLSMPATLNAGVFNVEIKDKNNVDGMFLFQYLKAPYLMDYVTKKATGGTIKHLNQNILINFMINMPQENEQKQIGNLLQNIDTLITLHQRKLEKLQKIKKSLLQKMFPENGANVPALRFKGFTEAWEQRKLGEIANKVTEKNSLCFVKETFTNSAEFGVINQRDFFDHDISNLDNIENYYIVQKGDFVYNPRISTSAPCGPINCNLLDRKGIMSPLYTVFRTKNINLAFLSWYFKTHAWHGYMRYNGDSGARADRFSIKDELFFQMPIPYPCLNEQNQIGVFFSNLDRLITLHQRKLEKLQKIKKSMLERMFI